MALPKINPTSTQAWSNLQEHFTAMESVKMQTLFANEIDRKRAYEPCYRSSFIRLFKK